MIGTPDTLDRSIENIIELIYNRIDADGCEITFGFFDSFEWTFWAEIKDRDGGTIAQVLGCDSPQEAFHELYKEM